MKKSILFTILALELTGCAFVPSQLGSALIQQNKEAITATELMPRRIGKACGHNLLGIIAAGDISIEKAKSNGQIRKVATVDKEIFSNLGVYSKVCTIVTGE